MKKSTSVIELKDFALFEVHLRIPQDHSKGDSSDGSFDIELSPRSTKDSPDEVRLFMKVSFEPPIREGEPKGLAGKAEIAGHFICPPDIPEDKRRYLLLYNGAIILYGLLRGQLAAMTGSFPTGRFMLPSVNMQQVVQDWLERQMKLPAMPSKQKALGGKTIQKSPPPARRKEARKKKPAQ